MHVARSQVVRRKQHCALRKRGGWLRVWRILAFMPGLGASCTRLRLTILVDILFTLADSLSVLRLGTTHDSLNTFMRIRLHLRQAYLALVLRLIGMRSEALSDPEETISPVGMREACASADGVV
jgi:hypothetical protein